MNFIYTVDPSAQEPIMLINKHIGMNEVEGMGIMGDQFQMELMTLDSQAKRVIEILICSEGGVVMDGYKIIGAMEHTKCKVDTFCIGLAASISAVIFEMGRYRIMDRHGILMFHPPFGGQDPQALSKIRDSLISIVSERTGRTKEEVGRIMDANTWMDAEMALKMGFCDEIRDIAPLNKGRASKITDPKAIVKEFGLVLNKFLEQKRQLPIEFKNKKSMSKIANKLNLNPEASEEAINAEIDKILNKTNQAEDKASKLEEKMKAAEEKMKADKEAYDKMSEEFDKMKDAFGEKEKEAEDAKTEAKKDKAKNMVAIHVKRNAILNKADVIAGWETAAVKDFEGTEKLLASIPVNNKTYVPIENKTETTETIVDNRISGTVMQRQAQVINQNKLKA
jgi:ATP-dependent Clp protease protease subunit